MEKGKWESKIVNRTWLIVNCYPLIVNRK